jgi:hypothetical protein
MNTEQIILLISLLSLFVSGLALGAGIFSIYQLQKNYPEQKINWYKDIPLWLVWSLIFILSFGLWQYQNWARLALIVVFSLLFIIITMITAIRLIGYVLLILNNSSSTENNTEEDLEEENISTSKYDYSFESYAKQGLVITIILAFIVNVMILALIFFLQSAEVRNLMVN